MTEDRFNELINGPLGHPIVMFHVMRLAGALRSVVQATGAEGDRALEEYCRARDERDNREDE